MTSPPQYMATELPSPVFEPWPSAINEHTVVTGWLWDPKGYGSAVIWEGGSANVLKSVAGDSLAYGINDSGQIVGATPFYTGPPHAFLYPDPKPGPETKDLNPALGGGQASAALDINGSGVIVGWIGNWFPPVGSESPSHRARTSSRSGRVSHGRCGRRS
jgi:probable HAF family extracellular repeat protein